MWNAFVKYVSTFASIKTIVSYIPNENSSASS